MQLAIAPAAVLIECALRGCEPPPSRTATRAPRPRLPALCFISPACPCFQPKLKKIHPQRHVPVLSPVLVLLCRGQRKCSPQDAFSFPVFHHVRCGSPPPPPPSCGQKKKGFRDPGTQAPPPPTTACSILLLFFWMEPPYVHQAAILLHLSCGSFHSPRPLA